MKKIFALTALLALAVSANVAAQELKDYRLDIGVGVPFYSTTDPDGLVFDETDIAPQISFREYMTEYVGLGFTLGYQIPVSVKCEGIEAVNNKVWSFQMFFGPAIKVFANQKITVNILPGLGMLCYGTDSSMGIDFGAGVEATAEYYLTSKFYVKGGAAFEYFFYNFDSYNPQILWIEPKISFGMKL